MVVGGTASTPCPNLSTTPLSQWGFHQCFSFIWTTLRGKQCQHPITVMGVVDTFGPELLAMLPCSGVLAVPPDTLPRQKYKQMILTLDGVEATIDALPAIVEVVNKINPNVEVYLDGGVREGTDVLKALALGAKLVCIGRPILWGLTLNGQKGVKLTLDMLLKELDLAMALSGCTDVNDIDRNLLKISCDSNL